MCGGSINPNTSTAIQIKLQIKENFRIYEICPTPTAIT